MNWESVYEYPATVWIVFGVTLLIVDIFLMNVYFLIWFGLGAICTGLIAAAFPETPLTWLIALFGLLSCLLLALWLKVLKPHSIGKDLESAREEISGQPGIVIRLNHDKNRGRLRLQKPVGNKDIWEFAADRHVAIGERLVVSAIGDDGVLQITPPQPPTNGETL